MDILEDKINSDLCEIKRVLVALHCQCEQFTSSEQKVWHCLIHGNCSTKYWNDGTPVAIIKQFPFEDN